MPLVDLKTDLKSLKYGRDRLNGGSSREPFISKDIEGLRLSDLHRTGGSDLLIRGGLLLGDRIKDDVLRIGKYLSTPEGLLWSATQNVLSTSGVRIYGGYPKLAQSANIFRLNDGTYLPTSTLAQLALNSFGGHLNKQGTDPTGLSVLGRPEYVKLQRDLKTANLVLGGDKELNRLLELRKEHINGNSDGPIYSYLGGPGAGKLVGGIGKTDIRFADQRTGANLKTRLWWDNQKTPTTFNSNLIDITLFGVSSFSSSEFSSYFNFKIDSENDNKISEGDGFKFDSKSATDKFYTEKRDVSVNRNSILNLPNEAPLNPDGTPNPNFDPSSVKDIPTISKEYTENFNKEYKVKGGSEEADNFNDFLPNPDRRFDDPDYRDEYLDQAKTEGVSSEQSSQLAPSNFTPPTPNDNGVDGNNTISEQGNPTTPTRKSYATPPTTTLQGATGAYDASNPTYGNILNTTPSPTTQTQNAVDSGNDATLSKGELNLTARDTKNSRTIIDFRRRVKKKNTKEAQKNGALTDSLNWDGNVSKQIETRVNLGDPGSPSIDRSNYTKGGGPARTGVDKINSLYLYKADNVTGDGQKKNDLVKFRIATVDPDNPSKKTFAHFRAFLDGMSDEYGAGWNSFKYMGRGEEFYNYEGFTRNISLGWTVAAQSKEELSIQYQKLNYLASTLAPNYSKAGFMRGNIHQLTVGAYFYECPGVITSLNFTIPDESPWEIAIPTDPYQTSSVSAGVSSDKSVKELPHMIKVQMSFKPIHNFLPQTVGSSYDTSNPNGILGEKAISQRFISLENASSTGTNDLYSDGIPPWAKI